MAVAVKTPPGARPAGLPGNAALISLIGVVYLVACLAIVFKLLPSFWWPVWEGIGLGSYRFLGGVLIVAASLAATVGLLWLGGKLLGPNPPVGIRSGVFVGFFGLLLIVLLTRWASLWYEHFAFVKQQLPPTAGAILTGLTGGLLLAAWLRLFTRPWTQQYIGRLEEAGWFHATWYKSNQGRMVRQGTIIGLLLIAGAGVYTLISNGTLRRGSADWTIDIPFTEKRAVDSLGDAQPFLADNNIVPTTNKTRVQVRWPGSSKLGLKANEVLSIEEFKQKVDAAAKEQDIPEAVRQKLADEAGKDDPVNYLVSENRIIYDGIEKILDGTTFHDDIRRRLREVDNQTGWGDLTRYLTAVQREAEAANQKNVLGWVVALPTAVPIIDRYDLQRANDQTKPEKNVRVGIRGNPNFKYPEGDVVSTEKFEAEEIRIYTELAKRELVGADDAKVLERLSASKNGEDFRAAVTEEMKKAANPALERRLENLARELGKDKAAVDAKSIPPIIPLRVELSPASGTPQYSSITLLPAKQYTVPLLLLVAAVWLAWRVVNMPTFADFLIATEAEINKVSWTTQKRLIQDTIVVLVTVVVMSLFLFGTDYFWKTVLSWKPIGVLHIPEDKGEKQKMEDRKW